MVTAPVFHPPTWPIWVRGKIKPPGIGPQVFVLHPSTRAMWGPHFSRALSAQRAAQRPRLEKSEEALSRPVKHIEDRGRDLRRGREAAKRDAGGCVRICGCVLFEVTLLAWEREIKRKVIAMLWGYPVFETGWQVVFIPEGFFAVNL